MDRTEAILKAVSEKKIVRPVGSDLEFWYDEKQINPFVMKDPEEDKIKGWIWEWSYCEWEVVNK